MIEKTSTLVQSWIQVTDGAGRTRLESRWFETRPATPTSVVDAA